MSQSNVHYLPANDDVTLQDVVRMLIGASNVLQQVRQVMDREANEDMVANIMKGMDASMEEAIESKSNDNEVGVTTVCTAYSHIFANAV